MQHFCRRLKLLFSLQDLQTVCVCMCVCVGWGGGFKNVFFLKLSGSLQKYVSLIPFVILKANFNPKRHSLHAKLISLVSAMLFIGIGQSGPLSTVVLCGWRHPLSGPNTTTLQPFVSPLNGTFHYRQAQKQLQKTPAHSWKTHSVQSHSGGRQWLAFWPRQRKNAIISHCLFQRAESPLLTLSSPRHHLKHRQRRVWRTTCRVLTTGRASDGATNPSGRTHERGRDGWRWGRRRKGRFDGAERREQEAVGEQEPRERWGMTTCARGPTLRNRAQTLSRAGSGPERDRQRRGRRK